MERALKDWRGRNGDEKNNLQWKAKKLWTRWRTGGRCRSDTSGSRSGFPPIVRIWSSYWWRCGSYGCCPQSPARETEHHSRYLSFWNPQGWCANVQSLSSDLPLLELVVVELLLVSDLLLGRWWQQFQLPFLGLPQQLLGGDLNLGRSFVFHLQDRWDLSHTGLTDRQTNQQHLDNDWTYLFNLISIYLNVRLISKIYLLQTSLHYVTQILS